MRKVYRSVFFSYISRRLSHTLGRRSWIFVYPAGAQRKRLEIMENLLYNRPVRKLKFLSRFNKSAKSARESRKRAVPNKHRNYDRNRNKSSRSRQKCGNKPS